MATPAVVVFDLGKVLVDFDYRIAARKIAERGTVTAQEAQSLIDHSPLLFRYETGTVGTEQFYQEVRAMTGFGGDLAEFRQYFADIFSPIGPMIDLHAKLLLNRIPTFIFSNTNELAIAHIRRLFPFFARFTGYIYSYEHKSMKPDPRLYEVVERVTGCAGEEILYLDDRPENAEAGVARGWQVIHHISSEESIARVERLKLLTSSSY